MGAYIDNREISITINNLPPGFYAFGYAYSITDAPSEVIETDHGCMVIACKMGSSEMFVYIDSNISGAWKKLKNRAWVSL